VYRKLYPVINRSTSDDLFVAEIDPRRDDDSRD
jgi:hypothetical protein